MYASQYFYSVSYYIKVFHMAMLEQGLGGPCELAPPFLRLRIALLRREAGELVRSDSYIIRTTQDMNHHF